MIKVVRNSKEVIKEVNKFKNILKAYDKDSKGYMFEETMDNIVKWKEEKASTLVEGLIEYLKNESDLKEYIEKFQSINIELIKQWENSLLNIRNVEDNYIVESASIRVV